MPKRKTAASATAAAADPKRRVLDDETVSARLFPGLLDPANCQKHKHAYATSAPYKHAVISNLVEPSLLRAVRAELEEQVSFTEKETDIYKIFQSGDLANLDGLDDASLARLPSLLKLRDAIYSSQFRAYLSEITGSGPLSGKKTDMACNVYTGGCHLLCHDDVIGTRRISYILYLTHPDHPWKPDYGGGLRLYRTRPEKDDQGREIRIPEPDIELTIPPAFNQLAFFVVQPGKSFHDVEEVYYHTPDPQKGEDGDERVRMAISGWFHIPQDGEDGYDPNMEAKLAERSSLSQLQEGAVDKFDRPLPQVTPYPAVDVAAKDPNEFTAADFDFLLKFMSPSYLTPDVLEQLSDSFSNDSSLILDRFLSDKYAAAVRSYIEAQEALSSFPKNSADIESATEWRVARPPHKQRYLYQQSSTQSEFPTPIQELLHTLLPSVPFKKWLSVATGLDSLTTHDILARRFRRGEDYTLASGYEGDEPQLEFTLCLTPTDGWEEEDDDDDVEEMDGDGDGDIENKENVDKKSQENETKAEKPPSKKHEFLPVGGYEIYMSGDDDEPQPPPEELSNANPATHTTGGNSTKTLDPAVYRTGDDDGILFSSAAAWNRFLLVLRDKGTLRFVKYVSASAKGDRWDVTGSVGVEWGNDDEDEEEGEEENEKENRNEGMDVYGKE